MIDTNKLWILLGESTKRPWKQTYAYNNGGIPTADFHIPGHNGGATVEMLAVDAELIVEAVKVLPDLLAIFEAAVKFKEAHIDFPNSPPMSETDKQIAVGKLFARRDDLLELVSAALKDSDQ